MGGPSLWNSNIVSTLQEPVSNNSSINSPDGQNGGNVSSGSGVIVQNNAGLTAVAAITTPIASSKKTSKSPNSSTGGNGGGGSTSSTNASSASSKSRSNKSKSKLSRVRYFLHPKFGQIWLSGTQKIADTAQFVLKLAGSFAAVYCRYSYTKYGFN